MQSAAQAAAGALAPANESQQQRASTSRMLDKALIDQLWLLMTQAFGHRWTTNFGNTDRGGVWARGLVGLEWNEITAGVAKCVEQALEWPPTLGEFRKLCRPGKERRENWQAYQPQPRQLRHMLTQEQRERGRAGIAEARAALLAGGRG